MKHRFEELREEREGCEEKFLRQLRVLRATLQICVSSVRICGQNFLEFSHCFCELRFGDGQRRREANDIAVFAFGQKNVAAMQKSFDRVDCDFRRWFSVGQIQFNSRHQTEAASQVLSFEF